MRRTLLACLLPALLLLACTMTTAVGPTTGLGDDAIAVTALDAPAAAASPAATASASPAATASDAVQPETVPPSTAPAEVQTAEPAVPEAPKTAEQQLCEKSKGQWVAAGDTGAFYCASMTRDGGKQCRKKTDCQGVCLARSGTCSPITPLYGCNDVLEKDGRMVTLCID